MEHVQYWMSDVVTVTELARYNVVRILERESVLYVLTQDIDAFLGPCVTMYNPALYYITSLVWFNSEYHIAITTNRMLHLGNSIAWLGQICRRIAEHAYSLREPIGKSNTSEECEDDITHHEDENNDKLHNTDSYAHTPGIFTATITTTLNRHRKYIYASFHNKAELIGYIVDLHNNGYSVDDINTHYTITYEQARIIENTVFIHTVKSGTSCGSQSNVRMSIADVREKIIQKFMTS